MNKKYVLIKSENEFKAENRWNEDCNVPEGWNRNGKMTYLLGAVADVETIVTPNETDRYIVRSNNEFGDGMWHLIEEDIVKRVTKEENPEYFL